MIHYASLTAQCTYTDLSRMTIKKDCLLPTRRHRSFRPQQNRRQRQRRWRFHRRCGSSSRISDIFGSDILCSSGRGAYSRRRRGYDERRREFRQSTPGMTRTRYEAQIAADIRVVWIDDRRRRLVRQNRMTSNQLGQKLVLVYILVV